MKISLFIGCPDGEILREMIYWFLIFLISKIGDIVMLVPKDAKWEGFLNSLTMFSDDFLEERGTVDTEEREQL